MEGPEEKGAAVSLRCKSSLGSIPLSYTWKRETGGAIPPTATQGEDKQEAPPPLLLFGDVTPHPLTPVFCPADPQTGELLINNHTDANVGSYVCEAKNAVGQAECKYTLHAYNRKCGGSVYTPLFHLQAQIFVLSSQRRD